MRKPGHPDSEVARINNPGGKMIEEGDQKCLEVGVRTGCPQPAVMECSSRRGEAQVAVDVPTEVQVVGENEIG